MKNPFRSEDEAYRFLIATIVYFAAIVAAAGVNRWLGVAVFIALTVVALRWLTQKEEVAPRRTGSKAGADNVRRILVVANETVAGDVLRSEIRRRAEGVEEQVLVICPALNSPLRHWASDEDGARADAQSRLEASLAKLKADGVDARGEIGDGDPIQAIEDALRLFGAEEIIISTHPEGRSHWLERGVVESARERFDVPITHVVVDLGAEPAG